MTILEMNAARPIVSYLSKWWLLGNICHEEQQKYFVARANIFLVT